MAPRRSLPHPRRPSAGRGERAIRSILDLGMKLHVPYNGDLKLIDGLRPLAPFIRAIYLPCDPRVAGTGRSLADRDWDAYDREVATLVDGLRPLGIQVNMLFNGCWIDPRVVATFPSTALYFYLKRQAERGLEWVTISHIALARMVRRYFPELKLDLSTVAMVGSVERARYWQDRVAPDMICVDDDRARDLRLIRSLRETFGAPVKIIANSKCLTDCPFKWVHQTYHSRCEDNPFDCWRVRARFPWHAYHGLIIPPYYLRCYEGLVEDIKLVDRASPTPEILDIVRFYAEPCDSRQHLSPAYRASGPTATRLFQQARCKHPWMRALDAKVFHKTSTCNRDCATCGLCYRTWRREWRVVEDLDVLRRCLARVSRSRADTVYYTEMLDALHARMHDQTFLRQLHLHLAYCDKRYHDLLRYLLAIARAESGAPDLAARDAAAVGDAEVRSSLRRILAGLRGAPPLRYQPTDERDPRSFSSLAALRGSTAPTAPLRLLEFFCGAREEEQARAVVPALGEPGRQAAGRLITLALASRLYQLTLDLCERFRAETPAHEVALAELMARFRTGRAWRPAFQRLRRTAAAPSYLHLVYAWWRLCAEAGARAIPAATVDRLFDFSAALVRDGDLAYAAEVLDLVRAARPRDRRVLIHLRELLLEENLPARARAVSALVDPATQRLLETGAASGQGPDGGPAVPAGRGRPTRSDAKPGRTARGPDRARRPRVP